jgi:hypothetical protein
MGGERFLIIGRALHRLQSGLRIAPNLPLMLSGRPGESHRLESHQSGRQRLLADCREPSEAGTRRVSRDPEVVGDSIQRLSSRHDQPVQRGEALQWHLPPKRESSILLCPVAKLYGGEMLRHGSKTVADVLSIQPEFLAPFIQAPESDVDVGMLRVEMRHSSPFERSVKIGFHPAHHVSREALQVEPLTEFGRDYQFPDPWIARLLPLLKPKRNIDASSFCGEPRFVGLERSTFPHDVFAMRAPMPADPITGISQADRTVLEMSRPRPRSLLTPRSPRTPRIFHDRPEGNG